MGHSMRQSPGSCYLERFDTNHDYSKTNEVIGVQLCRVIDWITCTALVQPSNPGLELVGTLPWVAPRLLGERIPRTWIALHMMEANRIVTAYELHIV